MEVAGVTWEFVEFCPHLNSRCSMQSTKQTSLCTVWLRSDRTVMVQMHRNALGGQDLAQGAYWCKLQMLTFAFHETFNVRMRSSVMTGGASAADTPAYAAPAAGGGAAAAAAAAAACCACCCDAAAARRAAASFFSLASSACLCIHG